MKKPILLAVLCTLSLGAFAQKINQTHSEIIGQLASIKEVKNKLITRDQSGAEVMYMKCNEMMNLCNDMVPTSSAMVMMLPGDSLAAFGIQKYLDIKMMGLQDSLASCHFSLAGANLPASRRAQNCSATIVLDKEKGWMVSQHQCRQ